MREMAPVETFRDTKVGYRSVVPQNEISYNTPANLFIDSLYMSQKIRY